MKRRVLITGGSGFIGTRVHVELLKRGFDVLNIDKQPPRLPNLQHAYKQCDIMNREALQGIATTFAPDFLIHLAARIDLNETKDLSGYSANMAGVENVIAALRKTPTIRMSVFTSSQLVCHVKHTPVSEFDYCPTTLYGQSKVQTERIVRREHGDSKSWCLVRPTTIWGPGMSAHYQRLLRMIQKGRYFHIGSRPLRKTYGFVGNAAYQLCQLLEANPTFTNGKVLYIADYEPISLREWTTGLQQALNAPKIRTIPEGLARRLARLGDLLVSCGLTSFPFTSFRLDNVLTEAYFNLEPTKAACGPLPYSTAEGLTETANWFRNLSSHDAP